MQVYGRKRARLIHLVSTVHQADLDLEEKILRHFDLSSQYGVCICIYCHGLRRDLE